MTAVVAGAFAGGWFAGQPDQTYAPQVPASQPISVTAAQARGPQSPSPWPTLGNRANDRGPGHAAMEILLSDGYGPNSFVNVPDLRPRSQTPLFYEHHDPTGQIMFSGTVPHLPRTTLVSTSGELLQYASGPGSGPEKTVNRAPAPFEDDPITSPPIALNWTAHPDEPYPLAVPPWLTDVQVEGIDGKDVGWRPLKVTDGLSAPVPVFGYKSSAYADSPVVDARGDCGTGALIQADNTFEGKTSKVTFVYRPGWPYAVSVDFRSDTSSAPSRPAPFDQAYVRRLAGALLCGTPGMGETDPPASEVSWTPEWQGTPSPGGGQVAVIRQDVSYPVGGGYGGDFRSGLLEVGVDKASVYTDLGDTYGDHTAEDFEVSTGCVTGSDGLTVIGPATATTISLVDPLTGRHWAGHGHVLTVPGSGLPHKGTGLTVTAVTPGKNGETATGSCQAP